MFSIRITMILCSKTMIMWNENICNYNEIMRSGFERMTSGVTSVLSFEKVLKMYTLLKYYQTNGKKTVVWQITIVMVCFRQALLMKHSVRYFLTS